MVSIQIAEGGRAINLTAAKLKTAQQGGGSCLWVPESDVALATKDITQNGVYVAALDGVYGWSRVYVDVPLEGKHIEGIGPDGKTYSVDKDADGNVTVTEVTP